MIVLTLAFPPVASGQTKTGRTDCFENASTQGSVELTPPWREWGRRSLRFRSAYTVRLDDISQRAVGHGRSARAALHRHLWASAGAHAGHGCTRRTRRPLRRGVLPLAALRAIAPVDDVGPARLRCRRVGQRCRVARGGSDHRALDEPGGLPDPCCRARCTSSVPTSCTASASA